MSDVRPDLTLDEKIQRKLKREMGDRGKGRSCGEPASSISPQSSDGDNGEEDREAIRKLLMEKRKNMPVTKHISDSMKMKMNAEDLAKLEMDELLEEEGTPKGWSCNKCTFLNENVDHLACTMCGAPRYKT